MVWTMGVGIQIKVDIPLLDKRPYGSPCLVIIQDDTQLVRILYPGTQEDLFSLGCPFPTDLHKVSFLTNIPLKAIYPIV